MFGKPIIQEVKSIPLHTQRCLIMLLRDMVGNLLRRFPGLSAFAADDIAADVILFEVCVENEAFFTAV
jgi:hypothetical protein